MLTFRINFVKTPVIFCTDVALSPKHDFDDFLGSFGSSFANINMPLLPLLEDKKRAFKVKICTQGNLCALFYLEKLTYIYL